MSWMIFTLASTMKEETYEHQNKRNEEPCSHFYPEDAHRPRASADTPQSTHDGSVTDLTSYELFLAATP